MPVRSVTLLSRRRPYTGNQKGTAMRMFAATSPDNLSARTAVPAEILRRLAFGRPLRRSIQPALPVAASAPAAEAPPLPCDDAADLDQRVRQSGEW